MSSIPLVSSVCSCFILVMLVRYIQAIDYASYRHDAIPRSVAKLTTRRLLERLNDVKHRKASYGLQGGTEYLLQYGALLRIQILDVFGRLLYEQYDDFSIVEVESLYRVYRETLERKYNIFDIVPIVLTDPDTRPSRICGHIHDFVPTCLKESTEVCRKIRKHDEPHPEIFSALARNITLRVYREARIAELYPKGFSPAIVLKYLQKGKLELTAGLLSGLLHNVRYDNFDDEVRSSERDLVQYLSQPSSGESAEIVDPLSAKELKSVRTAGSLLKLYLKTRKVRFPARIRRDAEFLAEHIVGDVDSVSENIHLLGNVYENGTIRVDYLFGLVIPVDLVDPDVVEARDYLVTMLKKYSVVDKYLSVDKYQQASPDQLTMEIVGQLREIGFAVDIATALRAFARFWHRSQMVENLNDLLELFDAYENLRKVPKYGDMMKAIDRIKENLWDSKNVSVEMLCNSPRACLHLGLQIVMRCTHVNKETKDQVAEFLKGVTPQGSLVDDECGLPMGENMTMRPDSRKTHLPTTVVTAKTAPPSTSAITEIPTTITLTTSSASDEEESDLPTIAVSSTTESSSMERESTTYNDLTEESIGTSDSSTEDENSKTTLVETTTETSQPETTEQETEEPSTEEPTTTTVSTTLEEETTVPSTTELETTTMKIHTITTSPPTMSASGKVCKTPGCTDEGSSEETLSSARQSTTTSLPSGSEESEESKRTKSSTTSGSTIGSGTSKQQCSGEDCEKSCEEGEDCPAKVCTGEHCPPPDCSGEDCPRADCSGEDCPRADCSGEDCPRADCSGEDCPEKGSGMEECKEGEDCTEVVVNCDSSEASCVDSSTDCSGEDCPSGAGQDTSKTGDCAQGHCEGGDKSAAECSGEDCDKSSAGGGKKDADCQGLDCPSIEDCANGVCPKKPQDETSCEGEGCPPSGNLSNSDEESKKNGSSVYCDNKDPDYQRKLSRLQKMMKISALRAAELLANKNSSQESDSEENHKSESEERRSIRDSRVTIRNARVTTVKPKVIGSRNIHSSGQMSNENVMRSVHGASSAKVSKRKHSAKVSSLETDASVLMGKAKVRKQKLSTKDSGHGMQKVKKKSRMVHASRSSSMAAHSSSRAVSAKAMKTGHGKKVQMKHSENSSSGSHASKVKVRSMRHEASMKKMRIKHSVKSFPQKSPLAMSHGGHARASKMSRSFHSSEEESSETIKIQNTNVNKQYASSRKRVPPRDRLIGLRFDDRTSSTPTLYQSQTEKPVTVALRHIIWVPRKVPREQRRASELIE